VEKMNWKIARQTAVAEQARPQPVSLGLLPQREITAPQRHPRNQQRKAQAHPRANDDRQPGRVGKIVILSRLSGERREPVTLRGEKRRDPAGKNSTPLVLFKDETAFFQQRQ